MTNTIRTDQSFLAIDFKSRLVLLNTIILTPLDIRMPILFPALVIGTKNKEISRHWQTLNLGVFLQLHTPLRQSLVLYVTRNGLNKTIDVLRTLKLEIEVLQLLHIDYNI